MRRFRHSRGHDRDAGASAVEFALVLPILMLFVFGIIEFGLAYNRVQTFQAAAREAGRLESVGVDVQSGDANARVLAIAGATVNTADVDIQVSRCPAEPASYPDPPDYATVAVQLTGAAVAAETYAVRIPGPDFITPIFASPDYRAEAVFRCEARP